MLQFIYDHAPIAFQNIMVSVQGKLFENNVILPITMTN